MGTDCKSAAFSFGGSNPPAPTKKTSVENTLVFFFCKKTKVTPSRVDSNSCGPALASRRAKKPQWGFFSSAARRDTRAHQKDQRRKHAGLFLLQKTKVTPLRVDSNSCGTALASRRAKKPQWGFFSSAARRNTRAHQKDQRRKYAGLFLLQKTQSHTPAGGFEQLRHGACVPPGKKAPVGLF